jgi:polyribonucleotide nucleotidyltransferase
MIDFLIENNYAHSEKAASKILEAASDEFIEFIQEMTQQEYDRLQAQLTRASTPEETQRIRDRIDQKIEQQRKKILRPKVKPVIRPFLANTARQAIKTKPARAIGRFLKYTTLGALVP